MRSVVKTYYDAGLNLIPLRLDGSRRAFIKWSQYKTSWCPWSLTHSYWDSSGVGAIAGDTSGGLEVLDFDSLKIYNWFRVKVYALPYCHLFRLLEALPIVATPSNGRHVLYRCEIIEPCKVLARDEAGECWVESKGIGNLIPLPPTPAGYHPQNKAYSLLQGSITEIPYISPAIREVLHSIAAGFNLFKKTEPPKRKIVAIPKVKDKDDWFDFVPYMPLRPGDDYNKQAKWEDILEPVGWRKLTNNSTTDYWTKNQHIHATTNYKDSDRFYCFSTSAPPFEANKAYSKFEAFALLKHDGNFREAAIYLSRAGYGTH